MTEKEKQIYKSGRKNPNGYKWSPFYYLSPKVTVIITILLIITVIIEAVCLVGNISWAKLVTSVGMVDGVTQQESDFTVYYLDVGQSDCAVIICDEKVLMIDSGTVNQLYNIRTNLFTLEIDKIDYLLITHQHDDHMGSAAEIINHYSVSNIMMPKITNSTSLNSASYDNLINSIAENEVNPIAISQGDSFMLGSAKVDILSPSQQDDDLNNMSAVVKITYGNTSFLFTGDTGEKVEKQLLRNNIDVSANVLKVAHHGSRFSSSDDFLVAVNPDYTVISTGSDNTYGHPTSDVIDRLEKIGIIPYITSINGNITVTSDGNDIQIQAEN